MSVRFCSKLEQSEAQAVETAEDITSGLKCSSDQCPKHYPCILHVQAAISVAQDTSEEALCRPAHKVNASTHRSARVLHEDSRNAYCVELAKCCNHSRFAYVRALPPCEWGKSGGGTWMRASAAVRVRQNGKKRPAAATGLSAFTATAAAAAAAQPAQGVLFGIFHPSFSLNRGAGHHTCNNLIQPIKDSG